MVTTIHLGDHNTDCEICIQQCECGEEGCPSNEQHL